MQYEYYWIETVSLFPFWTASEDRYYWLQRDKKNSKQ